MASYKAGDRVRLVRVRGTPSEVPIGAEGFVTGTGYKHSCGDYCYPVRFDGYPSWHPSGNWAIASWELEPATYLPDAEDLATQENAPDFEIRRPVPVYAHLRAGVGQRVQDFSVSTDHGQRACVDKRA